MLEATDVGRLIRIDLVSTLKSANLIWRVNTHIFEPCM